MQQIDYGVFQVIVVKPRQTFHEEIIFLQLQIAVFFNVSQGHYYVKPGSKALRCILEL